MTSPAIIRFGPQDCCHGALHLPAGEQRGGFVICPPFGEEAKCAYRTLYEMADLASARGWAVLRFDYFGTGNSSGGFDSFAPSRALEDVRAALARLRRECSGPVGALGLGLGAALALDAAQPSESAADDSIGFLILWQPLINGGEFYKLNIKRQLVRQMLTHGKARGRLEGSPADIIDLDGYALSKAAANELKAIDLLDPPRTDLPPTLLLQASFTATPASDIQALAASTSPPLEAGSVICEPFWKRIGFVDTSNIFNSTLDWLDKLK